MICLTFDTDHMTRESMCEFLAHYNSLIPGCGTFFVHDAFPELFANNRHEICPHPYIDSLSNWDEDLKRICGFLPTAPKGTRPHSCVFSHMIGIGLKSLGYSYVSQAQNLFDNGLKPFRHPWGIWELPIYYMDNMDFWTPRNWPEIGHTTFARSVIDKAVSGHALFVFDIHPLHIALNTRTHEDYTSVKDLILRERISPFQLRFPGRGAGAFFEELCLEMSRHDVESYTCSEALGHFACS